MPIIENNTNKTNNNNNKQSGPSTRPYARANSETAEVAQQGRGVGPSRWWSTGRRLSGVPLFLLLQSLAQLLPWVYFTPRVFLNVDKPSVSFKTRLRPPTFSPTSRSLRTSTSTPSKSLKLATKPTKSLNIAKSEQSIDSSQSSSENLTKCARLPSFTHENSTKAHQIGAQKRSYQTPPYLALFVLEQIQGKT